MLTDADEGRVVSRSVEDADVPGVEVELDAEHAEALGAFPEEALTETDTKESKDG